MGHSNGLITSSLFDETTFYQTFLRDLEDCQQEVVIESPYITCDRMKTFDRIFQKLVTNGVKIYIITRDPIEHSEILEQQAEVEIQRLEALGIQVLLCLGNHHRKLALIDRTIIWEGSLNILSQTRSREIMRRIESKEIAVEMFEFLKFNKFI